MYCHNCGREIGSARYCPICGAEQPDIKSDEQKFGEGIYGIKDSPSAAAYGQMYTSMAGQELVADRYRAVFRDPVFLVLCILETIAAVMSLFSGETAYSYNGTTLNINISFSLFTILFAIALWLIFIQARKPGPEFMTTGFVMASGTLKAEWIITWVVIVFLAVFAVLAVIVGESIVNELINQLPFDLDLQEFNFDFTGAALQTGMRHMSPELGRVGVGVIVAALVSIMIVLILINVLYIRKLHRFAKSVCVSLKSGQMNIVKAKAARNWLIVTAVIYGIGVLSSISGTASIPGTLSAMCGCASAIMGAIMINRYFVSAEVY